MTAPAASPSLSPSPAARFVRRLGPHHFAHLRACAEGLDVQECARRYLGIDHGHEARAAHLEAVDAVRAVARRRGESAWRLVGLRIQAPSRARRWRTLPPRTRWRAFLKAKCSRSTRRRIRWSEKPRAASA